MFTNTQKIITVLLIKNNKVETYKHFIISNEWIYDEKFNEVKSYALSLLKKSNVNFEDYFTNGVYHCSDFTVQILEEEIY